VRSYLADEPGHGEAVAILDRPEDENVTGSWTRIEVSGALVRAARRDRAVDARGLIASLDADFAAGGRITGVGAAPTDVEARALDLVREHGLRTLDAWHLATASLAVPRLAQPSEPIGFATRDEEQGAIAETLGFELV
jgi:uncharacterized protein